MIIMYAANAAVTDALHVCALHRCMHRDLSHALSNAPLRLYHDHKQIDLA